MAQRSTTDHGRRARLDALLLERGLAASRERARALVLAGQVRVDGHAVTKAGTLIDRTAEIALDAPDHPYVGRGGVKLAHALEAFGVNPDGAVALDVGASTGGFTDVLLRRGARRVVALDVGRHQLDWKIRSDPRVVVVERVNARHLSADALPADVRAFDIVTVDVSFISVRVILPALVPLMKPGGSLVVLVKPQFEAGRTDVGKGGVVTDPSIHARVVTQVKQEAATLGLVAVAETPSPIAGAEGNREFFVHFRVPEPPDGR